MQPGYYIDIASYQAGMNFMPIQWTSGASGATPAVGSPGFARVLGLSKTAPVVHGATGVYVVNLEDVWAGFIGLASVGIQQATTSPTGARRVEITAQNLAAKTVTLLVTNSAGAAVEPAAGDIISLILILQNQVNY